MKYLPLLVYLLSGCCTYQGKLISCQDAYWMHEMGLKVSCKTDDCGKDPK